MRSDSRSEGSPEQLRAAFERAAAVADQVFVAPRSTLDDLPAHNLGQISTVAGIRALVRAAATAYARRLRDDGVTPERMLVLVKTAAATHGSPRLSDRELTNDIVRWSIEAYFDR